MVDEFGVVFVPSDRNKADSLTRVRKRWLKDKEVIDVVCCVGQEELKELHNSYLVGVDRSRYQVRKVNQMWQER